MTTFKWHPNDNLCTFLTNHKIIQSKSEVRRLVAQKGIRINDDIILEPEIVNLQSGDIIRIGKKKFIQIK
jgi:tyrosyl-tRNA synthetase